MKKLFKEVWKSFSKSKVILVGLIILIFLTSGIITLIFDIVNSYKTQYDTFKSASNLQDVTMNSSISLYGKRPDSIYKIDKPQKNKYSNVNNLAPNQWEYIETNNYIDSININTNSEYYNLSLIVPNLGLTNVFVKTKELSNLLNTNLNIGTNFSDKTGETNATVTLDPRGDNNVDLYERKSDGSFSLIDYPEMNEIVDLKDTYDKSSKTWTSSYNAHKLYNKGKFVSIVINKITGEAFVEKSLLDNPDSQESILYSKYKGSIFHVINGDEVARMLGFEWIFSFPSSYWKINSKLGWILDGDINQFNGQKDSQFFKNQNLPLIKKTFKLLKPVNRKVEFNISEVVVPSTWFVYSQYKYIYTKHKSSLVGINQDGTINKNIWTGYYYDYLTNLSKTNPDKFKQLKNISYWTKEVYVTKVDKSGNVIKVTNYDGTPTNEIIQSRFDVELTILDLSTPIKNNKNEQTTIAQLEGIPLPITNEDVLKQINTDKSFKNLGFIDEQAKKYQYNQLYKEMEKISGQIGLRETITVNANVDGATNVFQFINLGNSNYEIDWNGIPIKQEVGKLINTKQNDEIFTLPSNIDEMAQQVPQKYIAQIIDQILKGLSTNRDFINPMISFTTFNYFDKNNNPQTLSSAKTVWLTKNGAKDISNVYGIAAKRETTQDAVTYFILKKNILDMNDWILEKQLNSLDELDSFVKENNLNFAPFDLYGNDLQIVGKNGWARQDSLYKDKYSVPFQYLLPSSEIINDFNEASKNPNDDIYGMERFRDNLIKSLTLSVKPLISGTHWEILMKAVNLGMSKYGFGAGLTPPAQINARVIINTAIGTIYEATKITNEEFVGPFFVGLLNGIKRRINPNGTSSIEEQKQILSKELSTLFRVIEISAGQYNFEKNAINFINKFLGTNFTSITDIINNPTNFLDGLIKLVSSINWDSAITQMWETYYSRPENWILSTGDIVPAIYKNIYSGEVFVEGLKQIVSSTELGSLKLLDIIKALGAENQIPSFVLPLLKGITVSDALNLLSLEEPSTGYKNLESKVFTKTEIYQGTEISFNTLYLKDILNIFSINLGIISLKIGDLIPDKTNPDGSKSPIPADLIYNPYQIFPLQLDLDLVWFLNNYAMVEENPTTRALYSGTKSDVYLFGINIKQFLANAINSFSEIKDDYNQITMTQNIGKIAIVNEAYLKANNKEVYKSNNLSEDLNDLSKIDNKYKINISGVEYVITGTDFSVDYMYPAINSENITVNNKTQALVYVNQCGFDRIKRSNTNSPQEKYFLIKAKKGQSPKELQTELNKLVYKTITGQDILGDPNSNSNPYKYAYLATESSLLNPERALRLTIINDMIKNLEFTQKAVGIMLIVIVSIVIMFVVRRYIGSRAKVLGILKAQGYSSMKIALSICLFPLFVSIIGATLGYVVGLTLQYAAFHLFSIFWTTPISTIPFNWVTFVVTLILPTILLCLLTIGTTFWFLHKNKSMAMLNGSMEVVNNKAAKSIKKIAAKTSVKNRFSVALALGSVGKLIALFISSLFTAGVTLFFVTSYKCFDKSINSTYSKRDYDFIMTYNTPTIEGGDFETFFIQPGGANDINNMLYVPVGDPQEGYTFISNYFKPGYNEFINKDIIIDGVATPANGTLLPTDTTTPHLFTKASIDLTVVAGGLRINVWNNLYNAIPESQRASIIEKSEISGAWLEWTQEGNEILYNGKKYITRFVDFNKDGEILGLWNTQTNSFLKNDKNEIVKIPYFNYLINESKPEESTFVYESVSNTNAYFEQILTITGENESNKIRQQYRNFLVHGYNLMWNFDAKKENPNNSLLNPELRSQMPEFMMDYFISPGALIMGYDENKSTNDETFTYINTVDNNNSNLQPQIFGYKENSKYVEIVDSNGNNLLEVASKEWENNKNYYPIIINKVVEQKYNLSKGSILNLNVTNTFTRYENKLKEKLGVPIPSIEFKFKIVGVNETYVNEEWTTTQKIANEILGLSPNMFNAVISGAKDPIPLSSVLPLYSFNGYWSANNKIDYSTKSVSDMSDSERDTIVKTYRELFYQLDPKTSNNISLMAKNIKRIYSNATNDEINNKIRTFIGFKSDESLDLTYESGSNDKPTNEKNVQKANAAIKSFIDIYSDDALASMFTNAISNGVEKEYIINASSTINDGMLIVIIISFAISLTILIMITSMIINENERNIAIFGILGYGNKEKIMMFFSIYVPIVLLAMGLSALIVWLMIPAFLSTILSATSIALTVSLSFTSILLAFGVVSFVFAVTCMIAWIVQGRIKPIMLLKGV